MIKLGICDDCIGDSAIIKKYVEKFSSESNIKIHIETYDNGSDLLNSAISLSILLLDIELKDESGIELGLKIKSINRDIIIIYITNYRKYHLKAHNAIHSFAYLIKPISYKDLSLQLSDAYRKINENHNVKSLQIYTLGDGIHAISINDIYYFEYIKKGTIKICCRHKNFYFKKKISDIAKEMEKFNFSMPHQSFVVNLKYIKRIHNYEIYLVNNDIIPLSQKRSATFREKHLTFLENAINF